MHFINILSSCIPLLALVQALPTPQAAPPVSPPAFYLVTTSQKDAKSPSSSLADVSAISIFDPNYQPNYLLRTIEPGYNSLVNYTLIEGRVHFTSSGPHGVGLYDFTSVNVEENTELQFLAQPQDGEGSLALSDGYLLTQDGDAEGWKICPGDLGQDVISWKGAAEGCTKTYLHAVLDAPY